MPNPVADFPTIIHEAVDVSAFGGSSLGGTSPNQTELAGKIEEEVNAIEVKLGLAASSPFPGSVLTGTADGESQWIIPGPLASYFDVTVYGAVGDGLTDDTAAITAAFNAALAAGGGIITLPPGIFAVSETLPSAPHIAYLGSGDGAVDGSGGGEGTASTTILMTDVNTNLFDGVDVYDFNMSQLTLTGPGSGTGKGVKLSLDFHDDSRYIHFTDVTVQNFGGDNIDMDTLIMSHFDRVVSYGSGGKNWNLHASGVSAATSTVFEACWAHNGNGNGWNIDHMVYCDFIGCGSDVNDGIGYLVNNCQSISFMGCGAESNVGNPFKVQGNSYNIGIRELWTFQNSSIGLYITGNSHALIDGFHENSPTGSPTASIKVDTGSTASLRGFFVITGLDLAPGSTVILDDGAGNITANQITADAGLFAKGTSGIISLDATSNGGDYNLSVNTTGVLALFGSSTATLNLKLLDGYLEIDTLTASTALYADSNKRLASSATTPTELGYVHSVTGPIQAQIDGKLSGTLDTDGTLAANSDSRIPSQKAVKTYADQLIASADAMVFKGVIDASANPNYPAADKGWTYRISVAGKIGGASGINVEIGDIIICLADGTASGNQATVGSSWSIAQTNIDGAVIGPASATDATPTVFDGTTGKLIKNITFASFKTSLVLVKGDVGLGNVDNTSDATKNSATATFTNKRVTRRVNTVASSATPTINTDTTDLFTITALAAAITSFTTNLSGTPVNGDLLEIRILDNGTARAIAWGATFTSTTATLPTTTVISTTLRVLLEWNSASSKWECLAVA